MGLKAVFEKGVETLFKVFKEAVKVATLTSISDTGFDDSSTSTDTVRVILDRFTQKDVQTLAFSKNIQPTDSKGLIPGVDIVNGDMNTGHTLLLEEGGAKFTVVDYEIDPMNVLYTCLLRKT